MKYNVGERQKKIKLTGKVSNEDASRKMNKRDRSWLLIGVGKLTGLCISLGKLLITWRHSRKTGRRRVQLVDDSQEKNESKYWTSKPTVVGVEKVIESMALLTGRALNKNVLLIYLKIRTDSSSEWRCAPDMTQVNRRKWLSELHNKIIYSTLPYTYIDRNATIIFLKYLLIIMYW